MHLLNLDCRFSTHCSIASQRGSYDAATSDAQLLAERVGSSTGCSLDGRQSTLGACSAGLDGETVQLLQEFTNVVYISCNPNTLVANLREVHSFNPNAMKTFSEQNST